MEGEAAERSDTAGLANPDIIELGVSAITVAGVPSLSPCSRALSLLL